MIAEHLAVLRQWKDAIKDDMDALQGMLDQKEKQYLNLVTMLTLFNSELSERDIDKLEPVIIVTDGSEGLVKDEE